MLPKLDSDVVQPRFLFAGEMIASKAIEIHERPRAANFALAWTARCEGACQILDLVTVQY